MSGYLSHLAALTLNRVEPVQPRLASRFETQLDRGHSFKTGLDVARESRIFVPPMPVQPSTVTATESPDRSEPSFNTGLDVARESRIFVPPMPVQPSTVTATNSPDRSEPSQQQVANRFETPVDRASSDHNGVDVMQESHASVPTTQVQPSTVIAKNSPVTQRVVTASADVHTESDGQDQPKVDEPTGFMIKKFALPGDDQMPSSSRRFASFDTKINTEQINQAAPSINKPDAQASYEVRKDALPTENVRTLIERVQERDKNSPVTQRVVTASADVHTKKESGGQDQPKVDDPTGFMIKKFSLPVDDQKPSSSRSFASFDTKIDTEQINRAAPSIIKPDAQASYEVRKDAPPTENVRTLVERVQQHFTETTHNEIVIREVVIPDANKKSSKLEESPRAAPVRPASITVLSEQSTVGANTLNKAEAQAMSFSQSGTDTTLAPTIQVTIGRVEIRAQQQTPPSNKAQRSTPVVMALSDYLNSRGGA